MTCHHYTARELRDATIADLRVDLHCAIRDRLWAHALDCAREIAALLACDCRQTGACAHGYSVIRVRYAAIPCSGGWIEAWSDTRDPENWAARGRDLDLARALAAEGAIELALQYSGDWHVEIADVTDAHGGDR